MSDKEYRRCIRLFYDTHKENTRLQSELLDKDTGKWQQSFDGYVPPSPNIDGKQSSYLLSSMRKNDCSGRCTRLFQENKITTAGEFFESICEGSVLLSTTKDETKYNIRDVSKEKFDDIYDLAMMQNKRPIVACASRSTVWGCDRWSFVTNKCFN